MKKLNIFGYLIVGVAIGLHGNALAAGLSAQAQKKVDSVIAQSKEWAANPVIVEAVEKQNKQLPAEYATMTEDQWKVLPNVDPLVRKFTTNAPAMLLKQKKTEAVSEAFLSDANGYKVAFLAKTTNWCHKGKPKHDEPMAGRTWQGKVEVDQSSGMQQMQISVPVLSGDKPIGSLVVGISLSALLAE